MEKKYQIFISSTYTDLIDARAKVQEAILSMMHFPVGMEMFSAADEEQWEIIQDTIDSSDYYILIIGHRYGSTIDSGNDAGISYTEKEFRYAIEKQIPVLAFILSDNADIKKANLESNPEKVEKLNAFKDDVKKGRIVEWWETPEELTIKVTTALHKQMIRKKRPGWVRSDSFDIESSHAEILRLNKLVRDLQEENANLKSKITDRIPKLVAAFTLDDINTVNRSNDSDCKKTVEDECRSHGDLVTELNENSIQMKLLPIYVDQHRNRYEPLDRLCVEPHLASYVSDEALRQYNESLPSEDVIDAYIENLREYQRISKGGIAFKLHLHNNGTAKATDIRASIEFPDEFMLFKISDIEDMKEPEAPKLPDNPIERAENEYLKRMNPLLSSILAFNEGINKFQISPNIIPLDANLFRNQISAMGRSLYLKEHSIFVEAQQIPHKDSNVFTGIYIVPTAKGKFKAKTSLMCSEYLEPAENYIDIEVV